jgi:hypothetical protein
MLNTDMAKHIFLNFKIENENFQYLIRQQSPSISTGSKIVRTPFYFLGVCDYTFNILYVITVYLILMKDSQNK